MESPVLDLVREHWPLVAVLGGLLLALWLSLKRLGHDDVPPYVRREALLTEGELVFYHILREAVADQWSVCARVRLADLIQVRSQAPDQLAWRNRILCKHIDFVLCEHETMAVRLAVELDDRSHARRDRADRDAFVDSALQAAGVPLLRVKAASSYDVQQLREAVQRHIAHSVR